MNRGILFAAIAALALNGFLHSCRTAPDPAQLRAVDSLITSVDAAMLTLNELDRARFQRTDSMFQAQRALFETRFQDTLDRATADALGNQFIVLRGSAEMGKAHENVLIDLGATAERVRALALDLKNGAMEPEAGRAALANEYKAWASLDSSVHVAIDNYRLVQSAWDNAAHTDTLLTPVASTLLP